MMKRYLFPVAALGAAVQAVELGATKNHCRRHSCYSINRRVIDVNYRKSKINKLKGSQGQPDNQLRS